MLGNAGWIRRANGDLVGQLSEDGWVYDASGSFLGHCEHGMIYLGMAGAGSRKLGYVKPGGELQRLDYKDAAAKGLGLSFDEILSSTRFWAQPVGRVDADDGNVTDMAGRLVGTVDPTPAYYNREDAMGTAALILLLRYA
jgi:hypothetical protein